MSGITGKATIKGLDPIQNAEVDGEKVGTLSLFPFLISEKGFTPV
jgi:hypothetical protein